MARERDRAYELWRQKWRDGDIPFHRDEIHPDLLNYGDRLLGGGPHRVLVPLCGKSPDLMWLAKRGHEVIGVEFVEDALLQFFAEHELSPRAEPVDGLKMYRWENLTLVCGDIFEVDRSHVGEADRVWDRAALIALPAHLRGDYTRHLRQITSADWAMLLSAIEYDTALMSGPPFSVSEEEIRQSFPGSDVKRLATRDTLPHNPRMRARGHTWFRESTYLLRDGPAG